MNTTPDSYYRDGGCDLTPCVYAAVVIDGVEYVMNAGLVSMEDRDWFLQNLTSLLLRAHENGAYQAERKLMNTWRETLGMEKL